MAVFNKTLANTSVPATDAKTITPSDTVDFPRESSRAIWCGVAGDIAVITFDGTTVTFVGVLAGSVLPVACTRVLSTGTTATSLLALY